MVECLLSGQRIGVQISWVEWDIFSTESELKKQLEAYGDDVESIQAFGTDVVTKMCETLLKSGAPGIHFYTLNQAEPSLKIWDNLGLSDKEKITF